jgi:hypothetical protein
LITGVVELGASNEILAKEILTSLPSNIENIYQGILTK